MTTMNSLFESNAGPAPSPCSPRAEATLAELLSDPLTQALMRADKVDVVAVQQLFQSVAGKLSATAPRKPIAKFDLSTALQLPRPPRDEAADSATPRASARSVAPKDRKFSCGIPCSW